MAFTVRNIFSSSDCLTENTNISGSGLDFTAQALRQNISKVDEELSTSFRSAYSNTLKPHHGLLIKPIFSACMSATPYRKDFYPKLCADPAKLTTELEKWLSALEGDVSIIKEFLGRKDVKWYK